MAKLYGYGVVDQDDKPYWGEDCVCADIGPMRDLAVILNEDAADEEVYRAVRLVVEELNAMSVLDEVKVAIALAKAAEEAGVERERRRWVEALEKLMTEQWDSDYYLEDASLDLRRAIKELTQGDDHEEE